LSAPPPPLGSHHVVPDSVELAIHRAMAKDPAHRFATVTASSTRWRRNRRRARIGECRLRGRIRIRHYRRRGTTAGRPLSWTAMAGFDDLWNVRRR
jgi:hypothetical protein